MKVLYISYTGLFENLGRSQILPSLIGMAKAGVSYDVVSFERSRSFRDGVPEVEQLVAGAPIRCHYIDKRDTASLAARAGAILRGIRVAKSLARDTRYDLVHCRNAFAAECALSIKRSIGTPYLLDLRGFWGDARKESGHWDQGTPKGRLLYTLWKRRERTYIRESSMTNCLTNKAKKWITDQGFKQEHEVIVTPCCVDFDRVRIAAGEERNRARGALGLAPGDFVCLYLGSLGGVYDDARIFTTFASIRKKAGSARLLLVGPASTADVVRMASAAGVRLSDHEVICRKLSHDEVLRTLCTADLGMSFCIPGFYSTGVSSTKLGEYLAAGLPVICNEGTGDAGDLIRGLGCGLVLPDGTDDDRLISGFMENLPCTDGGNVRARARNLLDIEVALGNYRNAYARIRNKGS